MMTIGNRLKLARENKNLKQVQVSTLLNINNKTLSGYERGLSEPDIETLKRLATLYEVNLSWLLNAIDTSSTYNMPLYDKIQNLDKDQLFLVNEFIDYLEFKKANNK